MGRDFTGISMGMDLSNECRLDLQYLAKIYIPDCSVREMYRFVWHIIWMRGFLYMSVGKIAVKISGNRTAWKHERFTPDSYYMLGTQQRHKWRTGESTPATPAAPFSPHVDDRFWLRSSAPLASPAAFVETSSRISDAGNPIRSQVTGNTYSS